ncbi:MAG: hypothetical protein WAV28_02225 [Sedimentisphaerales bacterium]
MTEIHTILTPLPQLELQRSMLNSIPNSLLQEGLLFSPLTGPLRCVLLNVAKDNACSDDVLGMLLEGDSVFWAQVPHPHPMDSKPTLAGLYYSSIADAILTRLFDCCLLFCHVPKPFRRFLWFVAKGLPDNIDLKSLKILEPLWDYNDWDIKFSDSVSADMAVFGLQTSFNNLSPVLRIEDLKAVFTDKKKHADYIEAGKQNVFRKVEDLLKSKYGPDANITIGKPNKDTKDKDGSLEEEVSNRKMIISPQTSDKWLFEGYNAAFWKEIEQLDSKLYRESSGRRFLRSFQFFSRGYRLENPHRFVALVTSLEALFCTKPKKIKFQLASRISRLLKPDDLNERNKLFTKVKDLYDIRSKIVHGDKYKTTRIERGEEDLIDLVRRVFWKILSDEKICTLFFSKNQNDCDEYLEGLSLGECASE